jgi:hypothetical protein
MRRSRCSFVSLSIRDSHSRTVRSETDRIQARAVRRAGELLRQFQNPHKGLNVPSDNGTVITGPASQREAAEQAGMSLRQERTAVRVSKVPEEIFERQVEGEDPPTVTKLANLGTEHVGTDARGSPLTALETLAQPFPRPSGRPRGSVGVWPGPRCCRSGAPH